jgi:hypothetical protein
MPRKVEILDGEIVADTGPVMDAAWGALATEDPA